MKQIRLTLRPSLKHAPAFLKHLVSSSEIDGARAIDWNRATTETTTHLYAIDGDIDTFESLAAETNGVTAVSISARAASTSYALLELQDDAVPMYGIIEKAIAKAGLVVRRPLVYDDGTIQGNVVGEPDSLQAVIKEAPETIDVQIDQVNRFPGACEDPVMKLSGRQREAIETALELGYYEIPRAATHEDIGNALGCAPNTVSNHLQKAERKIIRAGMDKFRSEI